MVFETDLRSCSLILSKSSLGDVLSPPTVTVLLVLVVLVVEIVFVDSVFDFCDGDADGFLVGDDGLASIF